GLRRTHAASLEEPGQPMAEHHADGGQSDDPQRRPELDHESNIAGGIVESVERSHSAARVGKFGPADARARRVDLFGLRTACDKLGLAMVTLVMTVFNGERFLAAALASLLAQSARDLPIIVVNDGSTDGSERILTEYARRSGRMQVIHQRNAGIVDSANRACALVETPYIARMDADDVSMPDRLQ